MLVSNEILKLFKKKNLNRLGQASSNAVVSSLP